MSQFIESICVINGIIRNIEFHQARFDKTRYKKLGIEKVIDLNHSIHQHEIPTQGKFKCRIIYDEKIESIEFVPYQIKNINSIKLIENNEIEYKFKSTDRQSFELISDSVNEDEILIVKNGYVTDTSYSNIVFFDGENWITPKTFLLNGTMRQSLLKSGKIIESEIKSIDLQKFKSFKLINAMMDLNESPEKDISMIS